MIWICPEIARPVFTYLKSGTLPSNCEIDNAGFVGCRFDCIRSTIFIQIDSAPVSVETQLLVVEAVVGQCVRGPQIRCLAIWIGDFAVELAGCSNTSDL